jgi:hypothetical protein
MLEGGPALVRQLWASAESGGRGHLRRGPPGHAPRDDAWIRTPGPEPKERPHGRPWAVAWHGQAAGKATAPGGTVLVTWNVPDQVQGRADERANRGSALVRGAHRVALMLGRRRAEICVNVEFRSLRLTIRRPRWLWLRRFSCPRSAWEGDLWTRRRGRCIGVGRGRRAADIRPPHAAAPGGGSRTNGW